jgi:DNA primase
MDSDEAGSAANLRAMQVVAAATEPRVRPSTLRPGAGQANSGRTDSKRALDVRVLALPQGKDPDELIRKDAAAWPAAVESARPVVDHLIAVMSAGLDLADPRDRSRLASEVLPVIVEIRDPVLQAHHLQRLSRLARVSEDALRRQLPRRTRPVRQNRDEGEADENLAATQAALMRTIRAPREEYALALLYREPSLEELTEDLAEDVFSLSENRELFRRWRAGEAISEEDSELWEQLQRVNETRIAVNDTEQLRAAFLDCVERLQHARIRAAKEASALALAEGEAGVRPGQVASIARARLAAGTIEGEAREDGAAETAASQLLDDMEAGLRLHRPLIEASRPDRPGQRSN